MKTVRLLGLVILMVALFLVSYLIGMLISPVVGPPKRLASSAAALRWPGAEPALSSVAAGGLRVGSRGGRRP